MRAFLKSHGGKVWRSIETRWTEPTETNTEGEKVAKSFEKYSKEEATLAECNDKALNALFGAVDSSQYRLISNCTEAKKAWDILETTHEGYERVKTAKLQILMTKYENLRMGDKEKIAEFHGRVRELANEAENLKRPFTEDSLVLKVLRALLESYAMDAKAIRQAHDIKNMTLDQLMGNLETIELQMNEEINQKKSVKQIVFHSHNTEEDDDDEDPSDGDYQEQLSLITKQFKKQWMQKKGRTNYQAESSKGFQFRNQRPKESRAPADDSKRIGPQCFECGGFGHIQSERANNLKKIRQAFVSTWSDEEDDSEEVLGNNNCAFTTQTQNEEPDVLTNGLVMLQEELNSLRKKLDETMQQLVETHLTQPVLKAVNGLEHLLVNTAKTFESENEEQSAIHTATHKASVEALATTIDNGRDAEAPAPTGSAEDKGVLAELEQIRVSEDAPTNNDPNSRIEPSCEAHKLSPKTDLEGTQYEEEFPPLSKESVTVTLDDSPAQNQSSDAHTLSPEKEMDGTLPPSMNGDDENISDPTHITNIPPPITNYAGHDPTTIGPIL
ncbi:unnamed protein product [Cuscuta campestris]|uniref:CCHC-type domain-containing protein n=1 Tax=Cuscuta campestris TaxID=132261 RepID=A0A484ML52_9ASTE|nr:unnamed protein product [Cuscuta campestris]